MLKSLSAMACMIFVLHSWGGALVDKTPSFNSMCGGNNYVSEPITATNAKWFAEHYDFVITGITYFDSLKKYNPNIEGALYTNLHMLGNRTDGSYTGWEYRAVMRFFDSAGVPAESAFVHFADSLIEQMLDDGTRLIKVKELKARHDDSATRVSLRGWYNGVADSGSGGSGYYPAGDGDWYTNVTSPRYRQYRAMAEKWIFQKQDSIFGFSNTVNYTFVDNFVVDWGECAPGYWIDGPSRHIIRSAGGPSGGAAWTTNRDYVDWDIKASILPNDATFLRQPMWAVLGEVQASMEAGGFGGCIPNVASSQAGPLYDFVSTQHPAGVSYEFQGDNIVLNAYSNGWDRYIKVHDTVVAADGQCKQFWEYRFWPAVQDTTSPLAAAYFTAALGSFLCMQNPAIDYFKFGKLDSDYWFKGHEVDLGAPVGRWFDSTYTDSSGTPGQKVIFRKYEKGMAIFRPIMTSGYDTSPSHGIRINLGKPMYLVDAAYDSTLLSDGKVLVKAQEGVLLVDVVGVCGIPPSVPNLSSPTSGSSVSVSPTLCAANANHGGCADPVTYQFDIADDPQFSTVVRQSGWLGEGTGTTCYTTSAPLAEGRRYYWRCRATNGTATSGWSSSYNFTTPNTAPPAPTANSPEHQGTVNVLRPTLIVNNVADPQGTPVVYFFQVSKFANFSSLAAQAGPLPQGSPTTSWQVTPSLENGTAYFWRARAYDNIAYSGWMTTRSFTVNVPVVNQPPSTPAVYSPPDGATITFVPISLTWHNATDPDGQGLTYHVQLMDSASAVALDSALGVAQSGGATTSYSPQLSLINARWYSWRVRAFDGIDYSPWMTAARFYLDTMYGVNQPPQVPGLVSPADNDTMISLQVSLAAHQAFDPESDPLTYEFALYTDQDLTNKIDSADSLSPSGMGEVITWPVSTLLTSGRRYFWSCRAYDGDDHSSWAAAFNFWAFDFSVNADQTSPTNLYPINGEVVKNTRPRLEVDNVISVVDENLYYFEVSEDSTFINRVYSGPVEEEAPRTTGWEVSVPLKSNHTYWWRSRANNSPYSELSSFRIDAEIFIAPNPYRPSEGPQNVAIYNMSPEGTLTITTIANEVVRILDGNSGGAVAWDVTNSNGKNLASDVYLCYYKDHDRVDKFKFVVIR